MEDQKKGVRGDISHVEDRIQLLLQIFLILWVDFFLTAFLILISAILVLPFVRYCLVRKVSIVLCHGPWGSLELVDLSIGAGFFHGSFYGLLPLQLNLLLLLSGGSSMMQGSGFGALHVQCLRALEEVLEFGLRCFWAARQNFNFGRGVRASEALVRISDSDILLQLMRKRGSI